MKPEDTTTFYALNDTEAGILTIYGEARGEPLEGKQAVACVLANRAARQKKSIKDVVYAKNQFSCYISTDPNYPALVQIATEFPLYLGKMLSLRQCAEAWKGDRSEVAEKLDGATFYRVVGTLNPWFNGEVEKGALIKTCEIGHHEFYREVA